MSRPRILPTLLVGIAATLLPSPATGAEAITCGAPPAGSVMVAIVVDYGDLPNAPSISVACVAMHDGANGYAALASRAGQLNMPAPRTDASANFLCGIDGLPAQTCAVSGGDPNQYWSYWHGGCSGWTYSNKGMQYASLHQGAVEGWRFIKATSAAKPLGSQPRAPSTFTGCPPPSTTSPPATSTTSPTVSPGAGSNAGQHTTSTSSAHTTTTAVSANATTTSPVAGAGASRGASTPPTVQGIVAERSDSSTTTVASSPAQVLNAAGASSRHGPTPAPASGSSSGTLAAIAVVLIVGALAIVQARRKRLRQ